jgi:hypothetical protein
MLECDGQAGDEMVITPAMVEAGVYAAKEHALGEPLADLVWSVYLAMETERYSNDSASTIIDDK